jgi:hypothetical protein
VIKTGRIETSRFIIRQKRNTIKLCEGNRCQVLPAKLVHCESDQFEGATTFFGRRAAAFAVGDGKVGIHLYGLKEYEEADEVRGNDSFLAGCDLLLVYDPASSAVGLGRDFGISQSRGRNGQCHGAWSTHFLLGDVNGDGLVDVGVVREKISCQITDDSSALPTHEYHQSRVEWQVYKSDRWHGAPTLHLIPEPTLQLPLLDAVMLPVDVVADRLRWPRDSRAWPPRQKRFVPAYRQSLPGNRWSNPWRPRRNR